MNTAIALLLQAATSLLVGIGQNANVSLATQDEAMKDITFSIPKNTSIWPTAGDLAQAAYQAADGSWTPVGKSVQLVTPTISFGDINNDGLDDAALLVDQVLADGTTRSSLAAMLNQDGVLFNIDDIPLGNVVQVYAHSIQNNQIMLDMQIGNALPAIYTYELLGNQLIQL
jgi:hypothetical protein